MNTVDSETLFADRAKFCIKMSPSASCVFKHRLIHHSSQHLLILRCRRYTGKHDSTIGTMSRRLVCMGRQAKRLHSPTKLHQFTQNFGLLQSALVGGYIVPAQHCMLNIDSHYRLKVRACRSLLSALQCLPRLALKGIQFRLLLSSAAPDGVLTRGEGYRICAHLWTQASQPLWQCAAQRR